MDATSAERPRVAEIDCIPPPQSWAPGREARRVFTLPWTKSYWNRAILAFLVLGVLLRIVRYLVDRPLWGDEAMLAVSILGRDWKGLREPLWFYQVAPIGFLTLERTIVEWLGPSAWSLRLLPTICAVASVPLFCMFAKRYAGLRGVAFAVAVFAVSYAPIRHGGEIKPYAGDLLASLLVSMASLFWLESPGSRWRGLAWTAVAPVALGVSHPAVFVAAGWLPVLGWVFWRHGDRTALRRWMLAGTVLTTSFLLYYAFVTRGQSQEVGRLYREGYWSSSFPPWNEPWRLPLWMIGVHCGEAFGYPIGGDDGASTASALLMILGGWGLFRAGKKAELFGLLGGMLATFAAASVGKYPYGGAARTMQHLAPMACLLVGLGLDSLMTRWEKRWRSAKVPEIAMLMLALLGGGLLVGDLAWPYRTPEDRTSRDFARWFWTDLAAGQPMQCVKQLEGTEFEGAYWKLGRMELYLAYRDMYQSQDGPSANGELRFVLFNDFPENNPALRDWLRRAESAYTLIDVRQFVLNRGIEDHGMSREERYRVYRFRPREVGVRDGASTAQSQRTPGLRTDNPHSPKS